MERTTNVCETWSVRRQKYGHLPSRSASLYPLAGAIIHRLVTALNSMLVGDRGTCA